MKRFRDSTGFTLVELIVTIVVAGIFIAAISNMSSLIVYTATDAHRFELASNLAYNNLRIYANGQKPVWFNCVGDDGSETAPFTDGNKTNAAGIDILSSTADVSGLPSPVTQTVNVLAPYGCGSDSPNGSGMPIRVVSTVTYGSPAKKVIHATYVGY